MNADREAEEFLKSEGKMEQLGAAVSILRGIGFERILRRLGEPINLAADHPHFIQQAAAQTSETIGWYKAIDTLFNFATVVGNVSEENSKEPDYGAKDLLKEHMGYTEEDLQGL